ncbi:hypothetical protein EVAR_71539_1 [Eumeta japonica]|uniref:Uncharacterized protein n=1 Tax=Eumeta variegata TaxID=151549 RepID=A0A4C1T3Q9_EUMVA|nr:hypothetical protein EVAR_71539_1 [Eumeta japonica]
MGKGPGVPGGAGPAAGGGRGRGRGGGRFRPPKLTEPFPPAHAFLACLCAVNPKQNNTEMKAQATHMNKTDCIRLIEDSEVYKYIKKPKAEKNPGPDEL